jgi:hypothetical protein
MHLSCRVLGKLLARRRRHPSSRQRRRCRSFPSQAAVRRSQLRHQSCWVRLQEQRCKPALRQRIPSCSPTTFLPTRAAPTGARETAAPRSFTCFQELTCRCVRSDDDAAERPRKPVPAWARRFVLRVLPRAYATRRAACAHAFVCRSDALGPVLYAQAKADPDSIFQNPSKTCRHV